MSCAATVDRRRGASATEAELTAGMFDLQGHRGARGLWPENTLEGFAAAFALGVASVELDIAITRDDVPVVLHDPALDPDMTRGPDGAWLAGPGPAVRTLDFAALRRFDVGRKRPGSALAEAFPAQAACDGARVPSLAEVLELAVRHGVRVSAELKTDPRAPHRTAAPERMADLVVAAAESAGALPWLSVRSFDWRGLRHLRRNRPEIPLAWLTDAETAAAPDVWWHAPDDPSLDRSTPAAVAAAAGNPASAPVWAPDYRGLSGWQIGEAHALGLRVVPWTVNDAEAMAALIALGVDGICTDRPDIARTVLAEFGIAWLPDAGAG